MVREAYSLLRQSIIHVEQDDIDFDEEELEGERDAVAPAQSADDEDVPMAEDTQEEDTLPARVRQPSAQPLAASSEAGLVPDPAQPQHKAPKKHMKITHDQYMQLQNMIVLKIGEHEEAHGKGMDKEELIDWYLLEMEEAGRLPDEEQLEYHNELIRKLLRKLVKVSRQSILLISAPIDFCYRTTSFSSSKEMCSNPFLIP
jgi:DNA replication licensing factor MCM6